MTSSPAQNSFVVRLPEPIAIPVFRVAGPARRFDEATKAQIPQLWSALISALPFAGQVSNWAAYGVVSSVDRTEGSFQYMPSVGVEPDCVPPPGFTTMEIPTASHAVFRITLNSTPLHPQVKQAMAHIWGELIPASGLKVADGPDFESLRWPLQSKVCSAKSSSTCRPSSDSISDGDGPDDGFTFGGGQRDLVVDLRFGEARRPVAARRIHPFDEDARRSASAAVLGASD